MPLLKKDKEKALNVKEVNEVVSLSKKILKLFYIAMIVAIILIGTLLVKEWGILTFALTILKIMTPLFVGFIIAWLFNPLVVKLEKHKIPRVAGTLIVYAIFLLILYLFISVLIPTVYHQLNELLNSLPAIKDSLMEFLNNFLDSLKNTDMVNIETIKNNILDFFNSITSGLKDGLPDKILSFVGSVFSGIGTLGISLVIGLYMLFDFNSIKNHFTKLLPVKSRYEMGTLIDSIGTELRKCVNGTLLVAFIVFVGCSIGFAIIGLKAPLLFGLFCGITDLIPYIGPYIGGAAAVVVAFSQSITMGIICLIIIVIVQAIEGMVLQPIVMSKTMKLHPVTVIIGLMIFGHFFGIIGMIFATPCLSLIKVIYQFLVHKYDWFNKEEEPVELAVSDGE